MKHLFKKGNTYGRLTKGKIAWNKGMKMSKEFRLNVSNAKKGFKHSKESKEKMRQKALGRKLSIETRIKIGKSRIYPTKEKIHNWKGGKTKHQAGYVLILKPEHPSADKNGYIFEHRFIMERHIGKFLKRYEFVHHRNCIKNDNRIENLEIVINGKAGVSQGEVVCPFCDKKFAIK